MRYLTKEWYELSQMTDFHLDVRVHKGAGVFKEGLYQRLYKRKEKEFVDMQQEIYDTDPRFMLEEDETAMVPLDMFINEEIISEEDQLVNSMSPEEKDHIQKLIEEYDSRPPFDKYDCKKTFANIHETRIREIMDKLPHELYQQIADVRVFSLGYCSKAVKNQLKALSSDNEKMMNNILNEYDKVQQQENIPQIIGERFSFHDCEVTDLKVEKKDLVIHLNTDGGFTNFNKVIFKEAEIIKQEGQIKESIWLYDELYRLDNGYEVHVLLAGEEMAELIIQCIDIIVEVK
ncbi:DUF4085 family protein [Alkalibacterium pelagium]|uniref:DUF4085 domain-containing protein n=1 Tax=Alkalibacterium pelagium TaxID=426702 RepID=A0A1H7FA92_9LACT|nr:DUF4085 family protein [Alkalibacterium pelagium]GEN49421.1 hypothetical protein APE02nite_00860 [Alkalibacterium pelagium]SEK22979.1 Protein of unknown function [Alkalibacterium pelagium]